MARTPAAQPESAAQLDNYSVNVERFWQYVDKSGGDDACWPWIGAADPNGYGRFYVGESNGGSRSKLTHRIAFWLESGASPVAVCHRCDNPPCCNPRHLFGGTRGDNNRDMAAKGRHWSRTRPECILRGEKHPQAKLTPAIAQEIKAIYAGGGITQRALGASFGVSQRTVAKVILGLAWQS